MIAFLRAEPGGELVRGIMRDDTHRCMAHSLNLCEVYYDFFRASGESTAEEALKDLFSTGVSPNEDISPRFLQGSGSGESRQTPSLSCRLFCYRAG